MWGIPVPAEVEHMPQVDEAYPAQVQEWEYGTVAEILHEGSYAEEGRAVSRLQKYMAEQKFEVLGPHEEEYLSPPDAPIPRTLIRYRVRPR
jgi:effector-binding domain-containing protein